MEGQVPRRQRKGQTSAVSSPFIQLKCLCNNGPKSNGGYPHRFAGKILRATTVVIAGRLQW